MRKTYFPKIGILPIFITLTVMSSFILVILGLSENQLVLKLILTLIFTGGIGLAFFYFPIGFIITEENLIIKHLFSQRKIPLSNIEKVGATKSRFSFYSPSSMNAFNTHGFFGYLGKTPDENISYATAMSGNTWIILKNNKRILISLKNEKRFSRDLELILSGLK